MMVSAQALEFINCNVLNLNIYSIPFQILVVEEEEKMQLHSHSVCVCAILAWQVKFGNKKTPVDSGNSC